MSDVLNGINCADAQGASVASFQPRSQRATATWADIGLHRLCAALWLLNLAMFVAELILFRVTGLRLVWSSSLPLVYAIVVIGAFWGYFAWQPGGPREWIIPEAAVVLTLLLAQALVGPPMQYPALALHRPLVDRWLAAGDAALGDLCPRSCAVDRSISCSCCCAQVVVHEPAASVRGSRPAPSDLP